MYSLKINNVLIDFKIIDDSVLNTKISTEETRFSAKASMLTITLHDQYELEPDKMNIIELYSNGVRIWLGYVDETSYSYDYDKDITKFTCYDFMKKLPDIWDEEYDEYSLLGLSISDILSKVITFIGNYLTEKSGWLPTLSYSVKESVSAMLNKTIRGIDENGTSYEILNRRVSSEVQGIRFAMSDSAKIGLFCEALSGDSANTTYYFGVIDGVFAYYFSDSSGIRKSFTTTANYASSIYCEILEGEKIAIYWWKRLNTTTISFQIAEIQWSGMISILSNIVVNSNWSSGTYPAKKLVYIDGVLTVQDGYGMEIERVDNISDLGGYDYGTEDYEALKYNGGLSKFFRYPYCYESTEEYQPNCYKIMNDLAVYFDGFFSLYDGILRFTCESSCIPKTISYYNLINKGKKDLQYDLSDSLHPNSSYYRLLLEDYYSSVYGNKYSLYSFKTFDELSLLNTAYGMRVIDISTQKHVKTVTLIKGGA